MRRNTTYINLCNGRAVQLDAKFPHNLLCATTDNTHNYRLKQLQHVNTGHIEPEYSHATETCVRPSQKRLNKFPKPLKSHNDYKK